MPCQVIKNYFCNIRVIDAFLHEYKRLFTILEFAYYFLTKQQCKNSSRNRMDIFRKTKLFIFLWSPMTTVAVAGSVQCNNILDYLRQMPWMRCEVDPKTQMKCENFQVYFRPKSHMSVNVLKEISERACI